LGDRELLICFPGILLIFVLFEAALKLGLLIEMEAVVAPLTGKEF
jgi:hypothetical protein